jgi:hypothetical protein
MLGVSRVVLSFWLCKDVEGKSYLVADFSLGCGDGDSKWHSYVVPAAIATLVYPIGIPIFFFAILYFQKEHLKDKSMIAAFGFLYEGIMTCRYAYIDVHPKQFGVELVVDVIAYNLDVWWFEFVEMCNKLFLTCLLVFFSSEWQLSAGLICCGAYTMIVLYRRPHIRHMDDILARICQICIFLLLLGGLVVQNEDVTSDSATDIAMSVGLIVITVGAVLAFLYRVVQFLRMKYRKLERRRTHGGAGKDDSDNDQQEEALLHGSSGGHDGSPHGSMDPIRRSASGSDAGMVLVPAANIELGNRASPRYVASVNPAALSSVTSTSTPRQTTPSGSTNTNGGKQVSFAPSSTSSPPPYSGSHVHIMPEDGSSQPFTSSSSGLVVEVSPRGGGNNGQLFGGSSIGISSTGTPNAGALPSITQLNTTDMSFVPSTSEEEEQGPPPPPDDPMTPRTPAGAAATVAAGSTSPRLPPPPSPRADGTFSIIV